MNFMSTHDVPRLSDKTDPTDAHYLIREAQAFLLDVRGLEEFAAGHAAGATCLPLADLERRAGELPRDRPVLVMCQSGGRSALAAQRLGALGMNNITDIAGGFNAWRTAGLPSVFQKRVIPLERQVRIAAGLLILGFSMAGFLVSSLFFFGAAVIGFLLARTGALGICPMMSVLKRLPWNRPVPTL